jgi:hypothetical protein
MSDCINQSEKKQEKRKPVAGSGHPPLDLSTRRGSKPHHRWGAWAHHCQGASSIVEPSGAAAPPAANTTPREQRERRREAPLPGEL